MAHGDAVLLLTGQLQYRFVVIKKDIKLCLVSSLPAHMARETQCDAQAECQGLRTKLRT